MQTLFYRSKLEGDFWNFVMNLNEFFYVNKSNCQDVSSSILRVPAFSSGTTL